MGRRLLPAAAAAAAVLLASASTGASAAPAGGPLPARVFAPYYETWMQTPISSIARKSGVRYFTLAFIEATRRHPCLPTWDGQAGRPVTSGAYAADIAKLRSRFHGDVIPSFGGYSADHALTEIADGCRNFPKLVRAYESVIETLGVTRLDMDVEDRSLGHRAGIDRRNRALADVERWAARHGRPLQISYTLPVEPGGLEPNGLAVLRDAIRNHTRVDVVNIMTFDYYDGATTDMGGAAIEAARNLHAQLHALYPGKTSSQLWAMEGNTIMPGIDDYPHKTEVTYPSDARRLLRFAERVGLSTLSMWAIQRDNGRCPGRIGANGCSGIAQQRWAFSHVLDTFSG